MQQNLPKVEAFLGGCVLVVCGVFLWFACCAIDWNPAARFYPVKALFQGAGGLEKDTPVHVAGVHVGAVTDVRLNPETFMAEVSFRVKQDVRLPIDTTAMVASRSLLGGKVLLLKPGIQEDAMKPGHVIVNTETPLSLEDVMGQFIFGKTKQC